MKHTQGNWNYSKTINDFAIYVDNNPSDIAMVYKNSRGISEEEAEANAKLVSTAPDMLKLLESILNDDGLSTELGDGIAEKITDLINRTK